MDRHGTTTCGSSSCTSVPGHPSPCGKPTRPKATRLVRRGKGKGEDSQRLGCPLISVRRYVPAQSPPPKWPPPRKRMKKRPALCVATGSPPNHPHPGAQRLAALRRKANARGASTTSGTISSLHWIGGPCHRFFNNHPCPRLMLVSGRRLSLTILPASLLLRLFPCTMLPCLRAVDTSTT